MRVVDVRMFAAALPVSFMVRRALRSHQDLSQLLGTIDAAASARVSRRCWGAPTRVPIVAAWCFPFDDRSCVGRSLTAFALLRRQGASPSFVSGVAALGRSAAGTKLDGHAWLELDGAALGASDRAKTRHYREIFRHPPLLR